MVRSLAPLSQSTRVATQAEMKAPDDRHDLELLQKLAVAKKTLMAQIARKIIGQQDVVENLVCSILAGGHVVIVGVPGLAKTLLVATLAEAMELTFGRVQFTPDLLPADITGTDVLEEDPEHEVPESEIDANGKYVLLLIQRHRGLANVVEESGLTDLDTLKAVSQLVSMGVLRKWDARK